MAEESELQAQDSNVIDLDHNGRWDILARTLERQVPWLSRAISALRGPYWRAGIKTVEVSSEGEVYLDVELSSSQPDSVLMAVLECGVWHLVLGHARRAWVQGVSDEHAQHLWNTAASLEVAGHLRPLAISALETSGAIVLAHELGLPIGLTAEEYYAMLAQCTKRSALQAPDRGSASDGLRRPYETKHPNPSDHSDNVQGWTDTELESIRHEVAQGVQDATRTRRKDISVLAKRWADSVIKPSEIDWRVVLRRVMHSSLSFHGLTEYTYRRISRRDPSATRGYISVGMHAPYPDVAVVLDTSGSMDSRDLTEALAETVGIIRAVGGTARVASCDSAATKFVYVHSHRDVPLFGGGSTDMGVGINAANHLRPRPHMVVVLTDGRTKWPKVATNNLSVVAVIIGEGRVKTPPSWVTAIRRRTCRKRKDQNQ